MCVCSLCRTKKKHSPQDYTIPAIDLFFMHVKRARKSSTGGKPTDLITAIRNLYDSKLRTQFAIATISSLKERERGRIHGTPAIFIKLLYADACNLIATSHDHRPENRRSMEKQFVISVYLRIILTPIYD